MAVSGGPESPSEQHYSLKWNDYSVKLVTAFQSLRDEEDFVDVTVACDGHQYSAHKMVLSACSPYFRTMLRANPCQHPIVILKDVGHCELERLLEFMYNGEVNIAQDQLAAFLRTADNLKIRGLAGSSDEMEQICNRDYLLASTEKCLSEQHINNTCSSKSSVNSCNNNNNGNSLSKDDESASAAAAGMVASVGGSECYSPVPKKRKFILLAGCDQDVDEDLASAVDASDAVAETMVSPPAAALGVEVKCLARELKAEPCDVVSDSSVATVAGLAAADVYNTADAAVDSTHMYTLGVGANNSNSCNVSSGQHDLNAPHTEQGAVAGCEALNLSVRPHHNQRQPQPPSTHHHDHHQPQQQQCDRSSSHPQHYSNSSACGHASATVRSASQHNYNHHDLRTGSNNNNHHSHIDSHHNARVSHQYHSNHHPHQRKAAGSPAINSNSNNNSNTSNQYEQQQQLAIINVSREQEPDDTIATTISNCIDATRQQVAAKHHHQPPPPPPQYYHSTGSTTSSSASTTREGSPNGLLYRVKLEYPDPGLDYSETSPEYHEPKQEYVEAPDDSGEAMDLGCSQSRKFFSSPVDAGDIGGGDNGTEQHYRHKLHYHQKRRNQHMLTIDEHPGRGDENDPTAVAAAVSSGAVIEDAAIGDADVNSDDARGSIHPHYKYKLHRHQQQQQQQRIAVVGNLEAGVGDAISSRTTLNAINSILTTEMIEQQQNVANSFAFNDVKLGNADLKQASGCMKLVSSGMKLTHVSNAGETGGILYAAGNNLNRGCGADSSVRSNTGSGISKVYHGDSAMGKVYLAKTANSSGNSDCLGKAYSNAVQSTSSNCESLNNKVYHPSSSSSSSLRSGNGSGGGGVLGKVYPCSECHKVFRHPMSLHHHRHVHRGTYTCHSCSKVFSRRWDLHRHLHRSKLGCRRPTSAATGSVCSAGGASFASASAVSAGTFASDSAIDDGATGAGSLFGSSAASVDPSSCGGGSNFVVSSRSGATTNFVAAASPSDTERVHSNYASVAVATSSFASVAASPIVTITTTAPTCGMSTGPYTASEGITVLGDSNTTSGGGVSANVILQTVNKTNHNQTLHQSNAGISATTFLSPRLVAVRTASTNSIVAQKQGEHAREQREATSDCDAVVTATDSKTTTSNGHLTRGAVFSTAGATHNCITNNVNAVGKSAGTTPTLCNNTAVISNNMNDNSNDTSSSCSSTDLSIACTSAGYFVAAAATITAASAAPSVLNNTVTTNTTTVLNNVASNGCSEGISKKLPDTALCNNKSSSVTPPGKTVAITKGKVRPSSSLLTGPSN